MIHNCQQFNLSKQSLEIGEHWNQDQTYYYQPTPPLVPQRQTSVLPSISRGGQRKDGVINSKGVLHHQLTTIPRNTQVTSNYKGDQEPIANRTRSNIKSTKHSKMQGIQPKNEPIAARTRSCTFAQKYTNPSHSRALAAQFLAHVAHAVLDHDTRKN